MVVPSKKNIIVIGAGLGGISAALCLANRGFNVRLFEKNDRIGGKLNVLATGGFSFDLGPSILTLPHIFEEFFADAGASMSQYVDIVALDTHWRSFFEDGTTLDLYADLAKTKEHLESRIPGTGSQFAAFTAYSKRQYDIVNKKYFTEGLDTVGDFMKHYRWHEILFTLDLFNTMNRSVCRYFTDSRVRDMFNYFIKYVGSSAYNAPGFMNLMPWVQFGYGLWYVKGGMYNLAKGLGRLMDEVGVAVRLNAEVVRIISSGRRVTGVELSNGERFEADSVVSNMEVVPAYRTLCAKPYSFMRTLERFEPACSGLVLHLGVDRVYPQLAHHNFFYSKDQKHHFDLVFNKHRLPEDPTIYLVAPTRTDPSQAPQGCDNIKVLPHIPYLHDRHRYTVDDYLNLGERVLEKLERMGLENLRKHIVTRDIWTPLDIQKRYYSNRGAIYGVVSDWRKNFAFKAPKKSTEYDNLYFVGGSVNPGGGMPMVALSGRNVARMIAEGR